MKKRRRDRPPQHRSIYSKREWLHMLRCLRETPWQPGEPLGHVAHRLDLFIKARGAEALVGPDQRLWRVDMATALKVITALGQDVPRGKKRSKLRTVSPPSPAVHTALRRVRHRRLGGTI